MLGEILRPVASVQVRSPGRSWFPALMYIDSGADLPLLPRDYGKLLGMNLVKNPGAIAGVSGAPLRVSLQPAELKVGPFTAKATVAVAMRNDVPYLLGRDGVFRLFRITFEEYRSVVRFDPPA